MICLFIKNDIFQLSTIILKEMFIKHAHTHTPTKLHSAPAPMYCIICSNCCFQCSMYLRLLKMLKMMQITIFFLVMIITKKSLIYNLCLVLECAAVYLSKIEYIMHVYQDSFIHRKCVTLLYRSKY